MTADAIEEFLHGKQMPLLVENGGVSSTTSRIVGRTECWFRQPRSFTTQRIMNLRFRMRKKPSFTLQPKSMCDVYSCSYYLKVLMFSIQGRTSPTRHTPRTDEVLYQTRE